MWQTWLEGLKILIWTAIVLILGTVVGFVASGSMPFHFGASRPASTAGPGSSAPEFAAVAQHALPGVVSVEVRRWIEHPPLADPMRPDGGISSGDAIAVPSSGSGFFFDGKGHILTNNHVIENASEVWVHLYDGRDFEAEVVGGDPDTDVAVIRVKEESRLPRLELGQVESIRIGDWVAAIGNPLGHLDGSLTVGVVSGLGRNELAIQGGAPSYQSFIQTDAAIHYGNSGGPLVDRNGAVIGINTAFGGSGSGIGFAIPIDLAHEVATSLIDEGHVVRGYLGVLLQELDVDLVEGFGLERSDRGVLVREVYSETPAGDGGMEAGDVLIAFDGLPVRDVPSFRLQVARSPVGRTIPIEVVRFGTSVSLEVELAARPEFEFAEAEEAPMARPEPSELGLFLSSSPETAEDGIPGLESGVLIDSVTHGGMAEFSGLRAGDYIVEIGGIPTREPSEVDRELETAWKRGRPAILRMLRRGSRWYLGLPEPRRD